jgi:ATP synthase protein I
MRQADPGWLRGLAEISSIGLLILIATLIGLAVGWWLDSAFGTGHWLTLILTVLGLAAGLIEAMKIIVSAGK